MAHPSLPQFAFNLGDIVFFAPAEATRDDLDRYYQPVENDEERRVDIHFITVNEPDFEYFAAEITFLRVVTKYDAVCFAKVCQSDRRVTIEMHVEGDHATPDLEIEENDDERCYPKAILRTSYDTNNIILRSMPSGPSLGEESPKGTATLERVLKLVHALADKINPLYEKYGLVLRLSPRAIFAIGDDIVFSDPLVFLKETPDLIRNLPYVGFYSPFWASELYLSHHGRINNAANVYALAAVAYYLIAGVVPPCCKETDFLTLFGPRTFRHNFPLGLDNLLLKALNPHFDKRPPMDAFLDNLDERAKDIETRQNAENSLNMQVAVDTHIGVTKKLRCPVNQDAVFVQKNVEKQRILMAVADGVSTAKYGSGDIASHILTREAEKAWNAIKNKDSVDPRALIAQIIADANKAICDYLESNYDAAEIDSASAMGSTALLAYIDKNELTLASIGDSRGYIIRNTETLCITRDHNLFTMSIVAGAPVQQAVTHPYANALTQCLGLFTNEEAEIIPITPSYDVYTTKLLPGDHVLLTTDGLLDCADPDIEVSEQKIAEIVLSERIPGIACQKLIVLANKGGGRDNIGVGLIRIAEATNN